MQQHVGFFHWPRQGPRYWLQHTRDELLTYNNTAVTLRSGTFATVFGGFCLLSFLLFFFCFSLFLLATFALRDLQLTSPAPVRESLNKIARKGSLTPDIDPRFIRMGYPVGSQLR